MKTDHLQLTTSNDVKHNERKARNILDMMEVDIIKPSKRDEKMVNAMDAFASYVLYEEMEVCKTILDNHMAKGVTVGALQGGNDENEIYRVVINDDENGACFELISKFRTSREGKKFSHLLTAEKFEEYIRLPHYYDKRYFCCRCMHPDTLHYHFQSVQFLAWVGFFLAFFGNLYALDGARGLVWTALRYLSCF